jgi:hypothetical protein
MTTSATITPTTPVRRARTRAAAAALAALVLTGLATGVTATSASAAAPGCNYISHPVLNPQYVNVPALTDGVRGDLNCYLYQKAGVQYGVKELQVALNVCYGYGLTPDGIYGAKTAGAVKRTQMQEGVTADGSWGPTTRDTMGWPTYYVTTGTPTGGCWEKY